MRLIPVGHRLTLTEDLLDQLDPGMSQRWPSAWEAGRLVIAPQYRVGQEVVRRCLRLTLEHMIEHTDVEHFVGSCTHVLSRLYQRFGFSVVGKNVTLAGMQKSYWLIHGTVQSVYAGLVPAPAPAPAQLVQLVQPAQPAQPVRPALADAELLAA
jgi:hypothetical protein